MITNKTISGIRLQNGFIRSYDALFSPDGRRYIIDDKRYGGFGMYLMSLTNMHCEKCGGTEKLRIHHNDNFESNLKNIIVLCAKCHGEAHNRIYRGHLPTEILISPRTRTDVFWEDPWWRKEPQNV